MRCSSERHMGDYGGCMDVDEVVVLMLGKDSRIVLLEGEQRDELGSGD